VSKKWLLIAVAIFALITGVLQFVGGLAANQASSETDKWPGRTGRASPPLVRGRGSGRGPVDDLGDGEVVGEPALLEGDPDRAAGRG
jgi:hypothetical protein